MTTDAFEALTIGKTVAVRKTVSESDVYLFAGITGDLSPNHVDEEYMKKTSSIHSLTSTPVRLARARS